MLTLHNNNNYNYRTILCKLFDQHFYCNLRIICVFFRYTSGITGGGAATTGWPMRTAARCSWTWSKWRWSSKWLQISRQRQRWSSLRTIYKESKGDNDEYAVKRKWWIQRRWIWCLVLLANEKEANEDNGNTKENNFYYNDGELIDIE